LNDRIDERKFGKNNDWRESPLRKYLNGEFAQMLADGNMNELLDTVTDLTAMDGTTDYGHSVDKVTLLTVDQCRKYRYIHPLPENWEWTSTPDGTPSTPYTVSTSSAWYLHTDGSLNYYYCTSTYSARPAFTLPSSLIVGVVGSNLNDYSDAELLGELMKRQQCK
ncbi:MAG: hypothetical protein RR475_12795, partial [Clostridia bacterium]